MGNSCSASVAVRDEAHIKASEASAAAALHAAEPVLGPSDDEDAADLLLRHFNMEVYYPAFQIAGYTRMEQLVHLSAQDLDAIEQRSHIPILPAHRRLLLSAERAAWAQECASTSSMSAREAVELHANDPSDTLAAEDTTSALDAAAEAAAAVDGVTGSSPAPVPPGSTLTAKPSIGGWIQKGLKKSAARKAAAPIAAAAAQQPVSDQRAEPTGAADAAAQGMERPGSGTGSHGSSGSDTGSRPNSRQQRRGPSPTLQQQVGPLAAGRASFNSSTGGDSGRSSGRGEVVPSQGHAAVLQRLQRVRDLSRCHPLPQRADVLTPPGSSSGTAARGMAGAATAAADGGGREVPPLSRALYEAAGVIPRTRPLFEEELQGAAEGGPGLTDPTAALEGSVTGPLTRQQPAPTAGVTVVVPAATAAALRSPRERAARELLGWAPGGSVTSSTTYVTGDLTRRPAAAGSVQGAQHHGQGCSSHPYQQQQQQGQVSGGPGSAVDQQGSPAEPSSRASSRASSRSGTGSLLQQLGRPGGQHLEDLPLAAYAGGSPGGSVVKTAGGGCRMEAGGSSSVRRGPSPSASMASTAGGRLRVGTAAAAEASGGYAPTGVPPPAQASSASDAGTGAVSGPAPASAAAQELLRIVSRAKARLAAKLEASKGAAAGTAAPVQTVPPAAAAADTGRSQAQAAAGPHGVPAVAAEVMQGSGSSRGWFPAGVANAAPLAARVAAPAGAAAGAGCLEDAEELWEVPLPVSGPPPGHQLPAGAPAAAAAGAAGTAGAAVHTLGGGTVHVRHTSRSMGASTGSMGATAGVGAGSSQGAHMSTEEDEVVVLGPEFAATAADQGQHFMPPAAAAADVVPQQGGGVEVAGVRHSQHGMVMAAAGAAPEEAHMLLPGQVQEATPAAAADGWDEWAPSAVVSAHTSRRLVTPGTPSAASVSQSVPDQQQQQQYAGGWEVSPIVQQVAPRALEPGAAVTPAQQQQAVASTGRSFSSGSEVYDRHAAEGGWGSRQDSGVPDVGNAQQEGPTMRQQPVPSGGVLATPGGAVAMTAASRPSPAPAAAPAARRRVSEDDRAGVTDAVQRPGSRASSAASGSSRGSGGTTGKQRRAGGVKDQGGATPATAAAGVGRSRTQPNSSRSTSATPGSKAASKQRPASGAGAAGGAAAASPRDEDVAGDAPSSGAAEQQVLRTVRARQKQAQQKATGSGSKLQQPVFRF